MKHLGAMVVSLHLDADHRDHHLLATGIEIHTSRTSFVRGAEVFIDFPHHEWQTVRARGKKCGRWKATRGESEKRAINNNNSLESIMCVRADARSLWGCKASNGG
jgi:hypothetical protein